MAEFTNDDVVNRSPFLEDMERQGMDSEYLAKKLKRELNAKETKAQIPKGEKEFAYSKPMVAWDVRQKARQDAHKLRDDYPSEKVEHEGGITVNIQATPIKKKKRED